MAYTARVPPLMRPRLYAADWKVAFRVGTERATRSWPLSLMAIARLAASSKYSSVRADYSPLLHNA